MHFQAQGHTGKPMLSSLGALSQPCGAGQPFWDTPAPAGWQDHVLLCSAWDHDSHGTCLCLHPQGRVSLIPMSTACLLCCCTGLSLWVVPGVMKLLACF